MAGGQDAGTPFDQRYLSELGLCIVQQSVELTRLGNEDFQTFNGLTTHDGQLPS